MVLFDCNTYESHQQHLSSFSLYCYHLLLWPTDYAPPATTSLFLIGCKDDKRLSGEAGAVTTAAVDAYCAASGVAGYKATTVQSKRCHSVPQPLARACTAAFNPPPFAVSATSGVQKGKRMGVGMLDRMGRFHRTAYGS
jgi:hypothetical protein